MVDSLIFINIEKLNINLILGLTATIKAFCAVVLKS